MMCAIGIAAAGLGEEFSENSDTVVSEHAGTYLTTVVEVVSLKKVPEPACGAAFDIRATEDDAADPGVDDGTSAHGAWFFGDIEIAVGEAPIAKDALGLSEGEHFGVGGGVFEGFDLIPRAGDDLAVVNDDGTDGDFVLGGGTAGLAEGFTHEVVVAVEVDEGGVVVHGRSMRKRKK